MFYFFSSVSLSSSLLCSSRIPISPPLITSSHSSLSASLHWNSLLTTNNSLSKPTNAHIRPISMEERQLLHIWRGNNGPCQGLTGRLLTCGVGLLPKGYGVFPGIPTSPVNRVSGYFCQSLLCLIVLMFSAVDLDPFPSLGFFPSRPTLFPLYESSRRPSAPT